MSNQEPKVHLFCKKGKTMNRTSTTFKSQVILHFFKKSYRFLASPDSWAALPPPRPVRPERQVRAWAGHECSRGSRRGSAGAFLALALESFEVCGSYFSFRCRPSSPRPSPAWAYRVAVGLTVDSSQQVWHAISRGRVVTSVSLAKLTVLPRVCRSRAGAGGLRCGPTVSVPAPS